MMRGVVTVSLVQQADIYTYLTVIVVTLVENVVPKFGMVVIRKG